jgi:hypothetical protein
MLCCLSIYGFLNITDLMISLLKLLGEPLTLRPRISQGCLEVFIALGKSAIAGRSLFLLLA